MNIKSISTAVVTVVCSSVPAAMYGESAAADSGKYVTHLRDVEVVGLKQMPDDGNGLETVVEGRDLETYRITTVRNMSEVTPNFFVPQYGSRMTSSIYVRGLGARIDQPVVGLNVDNVPYLNKDSYDFDLEDISKIEVLRGTRSVLNGRNSMAGQVNIYTMSPWDYNGFRVKADFGRANTANASAGWYGKLSGKLATAVVGSIGITDGFYKNDERPGDRDCGREQQAALRWKLSWHPHSRWSLSNSFRISGSKQSGYPYENMELGRIAYNDTTFYRRFGFSDGLTVSYTGQRMIATSVTSLQYLDDNMTLDQDFSPRSMFTLTQKRREWTITQDIFAKGLRASGKYEWLLGAFGFYKPSDMKAPVTFGDDGIATLIEGNINSNLPAGMKLKWDERSMLLGSKFDIRNGGFALYHQSTYRLRNVTFQGGLRWDIEHVGLDYNSRVNTSATMMRPGPGGMVPVATREINIDESGSLSQTFNQLLPQLSVTWNAGDWELRGAAARGYKAGGYNVQMFSDVLLQQMMSSMGQDADYDVDDILSYKPEVANTYEVSVGYAPGSKFNAEITGFLIHCRDQQLTVFPDGTTTGRVMTNAGRTRSYGVEATMMWRPAKGLSLRAAYGFTNAEFTRYNNGRMDLKGKRLPYAPAHTLFASADYLLPWTFLGVTTTINANTRAAGDIWWDDANTVRQPFYATLNASVTFEHRLCSVMLWGSNITNTKYNTFYFTSVGSSFVQRANPWSIGGTLRLYFAQN